MSSREPGRRQSSYKKIDANTLKFAQTKGTAAITANVVVSADGKTRTVTQTGKDAQGRDVKLSVTISSRTPFC
jgi:hypothetical protein